MDDFTRLTRLLKRRPFLVADASTAQVRLVGGSDAMRVMLAADGRVVMNVEKALQNFAKLPAVGEADREFTLKEIGQIAGLKYPMAHYWMREGVVTPSIRPAGGKGQGENEARFSWGDGFAAGVAGSLRRHRCRLDVLRQVQGLFDQAKKRTAQEVAAPERP